MEEYVYIQTTARVSAQDMPEYVRFANEEATRLATLDIELYHALYPVTGVVAHREDSLQIVHIWRVRKNGDPEKLKKARASLEHFAMGRRLGEDAPDADDSTIYENIRLMDYDDGHLMEMTRMPIRRPVPEPSEPPEPPKDPEDPSEGGLDMIVAADDGEFYLLQKDQYTRWIVEKEQVHDDHDAKWTVGDGETTKDVVLQPQQALEMLDQGVTLAAIPTDSLPVRGSHCYLINLQGLSCPRTVEVPRPAPPVPAPPVPASPAPASPGGAESPARPEPTEPPA